MNRINEFQIDGITKRAAGNARDIFNLAESLLDCNGLDSVLIERLKILIDRAAVINKKYTDTLDQSEQAI